MVHERCFLCSFWNGERCTHTFRLVFLIEPIGGQVDFVTTPGMVPEAFKQELSEYMKRFLDKVLPAIEMMPIWEKIREYQLAHPEAEHCPGREPRKDVCHLRVVRAEGLV